MPLSPGKSRKVISSNIAELIKSGRAKEQAAAIALSKARGAGKKRVKRAAGGGIAGPGAAMGDHKPGGLIPSIGSGRSDTVKASVPEGSFIMPADVVSAFGDGNTLAGAKILDKKFGQDSSKPFTAPAAQPVRAGLGFAQSSAAPPVPILGSGGEYVVLPHAVAATGGGDIDHGHDILHKVSIKKRQQYAAKLKSLPRPKK